MDGSAENVYAGNPGGRLWVPGECDVPVRDQDWFWQPGREHCLRSVEQLVDMYCNSVGRNCNLLLNANPNPEGLIPDADFRRYAEFGREIKRRFEHPVASTRGAGKLVEIRLARPEAVNHIVVMEDIACGERVRAYEVKGLTPDGTRVKLCEGISIGHKRIQSFERRELSAIQLCITASVADPQIRKLAVFNV